ncbi:MAG TPA: hypothetical protein VIJ82_14935, partial [Streptosporangiaceae bacterium]
GMTFTSMHRPLSAYAAALFANGMVISGLTESGQGAIPWLLAVRADKTAPRNGTLALSCRRSRVRWD